MVNLEPRIVFKGAPHEGAGPGRSRVEDQDGHAAGRHRHADVNRVIERRGLALEGYGHGCERTRTLRQRPPGDVDRRVAIGLPFMHGRKRVDGRPGYEGMGLGLFIAKTLLERSGATISFANAVAGRGGAIVVVTWPRSKIDPDMGAQSEPLGQNPPIIA